ncbi:grpE protein homolog 1, mitochondrial isoform X2 [Daktulosphaira vitifoliae]|uniref:grpE protein homolog 1, mitochondrial isoform X2 n=1 Tax=Daktulosphaira vitifoliae TaxID=58002 RepID=UPI0021AB0449|nr:grpE protein homolog 1, mitochondrial isoform X2 [Daktulosphaira vitifoliae]
MIIDKILVCCSDAVLLNQLGIIRYIAILKYNYYLFVLNSINNKISHSKTKMTIFVNFSFKIGKQIFSNVLLSELKKTTTYSLNLLRHKTTDAIKNDSVSDDVAKVNIEDILKCNEQLKEENEELKDKVIRCLAESENIRKRSIKEIADAKIYSIQGFCKDLLDVADSLSKATELVPKEEVSDRNPHLKHLYEGLVTTESQLQTVVEGKEGGLVVVVSQIGYKLHDRVVRAAAVGISKDPSQ